MSAPAEQPPVPTPATETVTTAVVAAAPPPPAPTPSGMGRVTIDQLALLPDSDRRMMWINSLVEVEVARQTYAQDLALARQFAMSGQFEDLKGASAEQAIATAMAKIQLGRAWGLTTADAIRFIYFVNGRPNIENRIVADRLRDNGYDWDIEWLEETTQTSKGKPWQRCVGCKLWIKRGGQPLVDRNGKPIFVSFTEADADNAHVWERGKEIPLSQKANFKNWPQEMYYWRCIGRIKKYYAPDVLSGAILREEALDIIPAAPTAPEQALREPELPSEPQPPRKTTARDKIMQQSSFLEEPDSEAKKKDYPD
jgi:hypothetical protein